MKAFKSFFRSGTQRKKQIERTGIVILVSLLLVQCGVFNMQTYSPFVQIPPDSEELKIRTNFSQAALDPCSIKVLIWNVYKGKKQGWENDFHKLSRDKDLVLIQEAYLNHGMAAALDMKHKGWNFAVSFVYKDIPTGVLTASGAYPLFSDVIRSRYREPILNTPKVALAMRYELAGTLEELLVVNVHAINFVGTQEFQSQMSDLENVVSQHIGPVIFAGDFNTWSQKRLLTIRDMAERLKLYEVLFESDQRTTIFGHPLDHIFYKGLKVIYADVANAVISSDHKPIIAEFALEQG